MQASKHVKIDKNILLEWIYDDLNLVAEDYKVLIPDGTYVQSNSLMQADSTFLNPSVTNNIQNNQLFRLDIVSNKYGKVDLVKYPFLHVQNFAAGSPQRYDKLRIHFPVNYTFEDKVGAYLNIYTYDFDNLIKVDLSNFYYDKTDISMSGIVAFTSPPFLFQEKQWGKYIEIQIPSVYDTANQRTGQIPTPGSLNQNLTGGLSGVGLSQNSPIFVDFSFIELKQSIMGTNTFIISKPLSASVPQTPDFQTMGVQIQHSANGDFFEIFGIFNNNDSEFKTFLDAQNMIGQRNYLIYTVTLYEENVPTNSVDFFVNTEYDQKIVYRPVIISANTTAAIQVELKIINAVDNSQITKISTLGLLRDEIAKYGANLTRIKVSNTFKPKIYNTKGDNFMIDAGSLFTTNQIVQKVDVPYPVLYDRFNVVAKNVSENFNKEKYFGIGKIQIVVNPFDNVYKFAIANSVNSTSVAAFDLTNTSDIKMSFKSPKEAIEIPLYYESAQIDLKNGIVVFKISEKDTDKLKNMYISGVNVFYIVINAKDVKTVIYSGTFVPYESSENLSKLAAQAETETTSLVQNNQPTTLTTIPKSLKKVDSLKTIFLNTNINALTIRKPNLGTGNNLTQ
jgi:hypothetical protein